MKRTIAVCLGVLVMTTWASAMGGLGGYIYWADDCLTYPNQQMRLWQAEVDTSMYYVANSKVQFDNVPIYPKPGTSGYTFTQELHRNVEVYDPRDQGGTGSLIIAGLVDNTTPAYAVTDANKHLIPWDVVTVDPANPGQAFSEANGNLVTNGKGAASGQWDFRYGSRVLAAPANWSGTASSTWSALIINESLSGNLISHIYDADGSGIVDGVASEGKRVATLQTGDAEFGGDGALYVTSPRTNNVARIITRYWMDAGGTAHSNVYIDMTGANNPFGAFMQSYAGHGLAVGPAESAPIVYYFGRDNETGTQAGERWSIFGFQDMDGDNVITLGGVDKVVKVWRSGEVGIDIHTNASEKNQHAAMDIELYVNPDNGEQTLLANSYYNNKLFALQLADNGLGVLDAKYISGGTEAAWFPTGVNYFEIDMNPGAAIPEPGTMLLLGTGALGVIGVIRRRRMK